jgi:beta-lactamase regulating signal transducer with metallopeptidase domain
MNAWLQELNTAAVPMLLDHVWPMLWQSSLLIVLVVLAGRTIFRKASPQLRYALWGLVLIRLVVPPWVDLPTALGHWGMPEVRQHVAAYVPLDAAAPAATSMLQRPLVGGVSPALSNSVTDGGAQVLSSVTPPIQWSLALFVIGLWCLGVASLLLLLLARLFRMHRDVKRGAPAPAWIGEAVARYRTTLGVRLPVRIRVVPGNQSPALMGLLRPTILLPQGALDNLREDQLRAVLAHEIAHVKRWDFVVNWAQVLLGIAYFFHPLFWFANREMRRERELACDDLTLITLGLNREGYAESLLRVAEGLSTARRVAPVQVGVMEGELELARRLRRILDQKIRPVPRLTALSLLSVLAFAAVFGTWHPSVAENKSEVALPMEEVETRIFEVKVVDEAGQPLEGADVSLVFVRSGVGFGGISGLSPDFGKPDTVRTNTAGMAAVRYPRYVVEKKETAVVALKAGQAEYVSGVQVEFNVDDSSPTIVLDRGATLLVSGYLGERHNTVTPLFAKLSGSPVADWRPAEDGILERRDLWAKQHYLLLIHQDREGFFYFTDYFRFYPTQGMTHEFNLPLQKGVQLTGKISESVARPVKNGWVEVRVLPILEVNSDRYGEGNLEWTAHSVIKEDGSFLIEGLPRGRGRITAACDGAVSMGEPGPHGMGTPIVTMLDGGANDVEVTMIRTATAVVRVIGTDGKPVAGAKVGFWPLVGGDDQYFAYFRRMEFASAEAINMPLEESATDWQGMADDFSHTSDANGIATVENLPPWVPRFSVVSEDFELPPDVTGARRRSIELRPGETTEVTVELVAKGIGLSEADDRVASAAASEK